MLRTIGKLKIIIIFTIIISMFFSTIPQVFANSSQIDGFDKGPSYTSVVPLKKATFVNYDENSYVDDYAYLASVPTSVFKDQENDRLFSHPLLFYQDKLEYDDDKYRSLDSYDGLKYFMEDWMSYCDGKLDLMNIINVNKDKLNTEWDANKYKEISSENPYEIAKEIALNDWSYSNDAVIAVIDEEFEETGKIVQNSFTKTLPSSNVKKIDRFEVEQTNRLNPVSKSFHVGSDYMFIKAEAWWDGMLIGGKMVPTGDPDLQLYCKKDDRWMQAVATSMWNIYRPAGYEITQSYVYSPGDWRITITDFPTESDVPRRGMENLFEIQGSLFNFFKPGVTYHVDVTLYPGVKFDIPESPPFGCKDAEIKITWEDPNTCLGFSLIGPSGEAIYTELNESRTENQEMTIHNLGQCLKNENYQLCVFSLDDISKDLEIDIEYTFEQKISKKESNALTSASEGAVLASCMNTPLLFTKSENLDTHTANALYTLGVKNIHLVDIGNEHSKKLVEDIENNFNLKNTYSEYIDIYDDIRDITKSNDVVFTTIDPWTKWYAGALKPGEETKAGFYIGPATYTAAHHGAPVIIIDNHPRLSSASSWHNDFWNKHVKERYDYKPPVAEMSITGNRIYDFLKKYNFDEPGDETIITVAGQYDIGIPWDRVFPGVANSGRICGTPIDTSVIISRSMFYPALIFENPALKDKVNLIDGSKSERKGLLGLLSKPYLNTLKITKDSGERNFEYPTLCSFVTHKYRFNERASKYYNTKYECADGKVPGETTTMQAIDQGVMEKYTGDGGMYFPDMTETEVVPFYLNKGGFSTAFSTKLEAVQNNLNQGVILWIHASHGTHGNCGSTLFWDVEEGFKKHKIAGIFAGAKHEENPWRGYDWYLGSTKEPDTMSMDIYGAIPFTNHKSLIIPATGMDWVLARKPIREALNRLIPFVDPFNVDNLYDGLTGTVSYSKYALDNKNAFEIEENLENIHSVGFITSICQTSNTYLHLMMIRHGSVFQVQDPWPTSWYGAIWRQSIPRDIILGYTVGEAYSRGISHVGCLYIGGGEDGPQWWWDDGENVVYFGDPDLRMYVPENEYSNANHWTKEDIKTCTYQEDFRLQGHMPFGVTNHPHKIEPQSFIEKNLFILIVIAIIILLILSLFILGRKKKIK